MTIRSYRIPLRTTDLWRLVASLVLAIVLWGTITAVNNPERTRTFNAIDVTAAHLDESMLIVGAIPQVNVRLSGPRTDVNPLASSDVNAALDLSNIHAPGDYRVDVHVSAPGAIWNTVSSPSSVVIHVDAVASKTLPVIVNVIGNVDSTQQVGKTTPAVTQATVTGPATAVSSVSQVVVPIQIANQTRDFTGSYTPVAQDAQGNTVSNVQIDPSSISVAVQITARGKRLAVITQLDGEPAQGYEVVDRTINPSTVLVDGPSDELATLISVSTEPVEVTNATTTLQKHVNLVGLPEDVHVIDPADGAVDVVVQIRQRGVRQPLPSQDVSVVNLGPGLTAEVSPRTVSVTVVASDAAIARLTAADVLVQVNAADLGPGVYSLSPIVALPSNITWISTDPATVKMTITVGSNAASATPGTPSPVSEASPVAAP